MNNYIHWFDIMFIIINLSSIFTSSYTTFKLGMVKSFYHKVINDIIYNIVMLLALFWFLNTVLFPALRISFVITLWQIFIINTLFYKVRPLLISISYIILGDKKNV